jgi:hypothetical protein
MKLLLMKRLPCNTGCSRSLTFIKPENDKEKVNKKQANSSQRLYKMRYVAIKKNK